MNEWQPIETAPKDGTWIVVYGPTVYMDNNFSFAGFVRVIKEMRVQAARWMEDRPWLDAGWYSRDETRYGATRWQPYVDGMDRPEPPDGEE